VSCRKENKITQTDLCFTFVIDLFPDDYEQMLCIGISDFHGRVFTGTG
jgi:hypothetical protein